MNVHPLRILDQLPFHRLGIVQFDDASGDSKHFGKLRGAETSGPGDDLETVGVWSSGDGLNEAMLADGLGQLMDSASSSSFDSSKVARVRSGLVDLIDGDLLEVAVHPK